MVKSLEFFLTSISHKNILYPLNTKFFVLFHRLNEIINISFLKILQKYYQLTVLNTLDMPGHFHQKRERQLIETLMFICMQWTPSLPSTLRYCKDIANLSLQVLWKCLTMPMNNRITLWETVMPRFLKSNCGKLWCLFACK